MWKVIGQKKALFLLQRSLETGNVSHAWLFTGPAHSGKMTLALELAKALNCTGGTPPCGECLSCRKIAENKHADVQVIGLSTGGGTDDVKTKTEISIDQVRQMQHSANLPPFEGKFKVFIFDGAESMSTEAANSLLKILEEPESRVVFILLANDAGLLLDTVVSRCQLVEMAPVPVIEIEEALVTDHKLEKEKAALLARLSRGWFGWAVSAADNDELIENRNEMLDRIVSSTDADCEEKFAWATQTAGKFSANRQVVFDWLELWLDWWRDILMVKADLTDSITNINRLDELKEAAGKRSLLQIRNFIRSIQSAGEQLKQNANPRLVLEVLMLAVPEAKNEKEAEVSDTR